MTPPHPRAAVWPPVPSGRAATVVLGRRLNEQQTEDLAEDMATYVDPDEWQTDLAVHERWMWGAD